MNFNDLKQKYSRIDINPQDGYSLIVKDFIIRQDGGIYLSRNGFTNEGDSLSIYTVIAQKRTPEQIDMFLTSLFGE